MAIVIFARVKINGCLMQAFRVEFRASDAVRSSANVWGSNSIIEFITECERLIDSTISRMVSLFCSHGMRQRRSTFIFNELPPQKSLRHLTILILCIFVALFIVYESGTREMWPFHIKQPDLSVTMTKMLKCSECDRKRLAVLYGRPHFSSLFIVF